MKDAVGQAHADFPSWETVEVDGFEEPLPLYYVTLEDGTTAELAQVRRVGIEAQMIDPENPDEIIKVNIDDREPVEYVYFGLDNYIEGVQSFNFVRYLRNSVIITVVATALTLLVNSMAAFALSKYEFRGRNFIFLIMISTLMVPLSVVLVPVFLVITNVGWNNNLLGVIVPVAATPTGVFLLRQYMHGRVNLTEGFCFRRWKIAHHSCITTVYSFVLCEDMKYPRNNSSYIQRVYT